MPDLEYSEHRMLSIPDALELCRRCKRGLVVVLPATNPPRSWCDTCGNDQPGERYVRITVLRALMDGTGYPEDVSVELSELLEVVDRESTSALVAFQPNYRDHSDRLTGAQCLFCHRPTTEIREPNGVTLIVCICCDVMGGSKCPHVFPASVHVGCAETS